MLSLLVSWLLFGFFLDAFWGLRSMYELGPWEIFCASMILVWTEILWSVDNLEIHWRTILENLCFAAKINMTWWRLDRNIVFFYFSGFLFSTIWMQMQCVYVNDVMLLCYGWCSLGRYFYASMYLLKSKYIDMIHWVMIWINECIIWNC